VEEMMMAGKIEGGGDNDSHGLEMPEYVFEDDPLFACNKYVVAFTIVST